MKTTFSLLLLITVIAVADGNAQTEGKTLFRIFDAMPVGGAATRLSVSLDDKKLVSDITPGETSFLGETSPGDAIITVKDATGKNVGGLAAAPIRAGSVVTAVLAADGENVRVIPVAVNPAAVKAAIKSPETTVFIPTNLSSDIEYTFNLQALDDPSKTATITVKPYQSAQFPIDLSKMSWKLTGNRGGKAFTVPAGRFPPLELFKGRAAILMLPGKDEKAEIVALNAVAEGFILKDR